MNYSLLKPKFLNLAYLRINGLEIEFNKKKFDMYSIISIFLS